MSDVATATLMLALALSVAAALYMSESAGTYSKGRRWRRFARQHAARCALATISPPFAAPLQSISKGAWKAAKPSDKMGIT
jgi:hypothetical protein